MFGVRKLESLGYDVAKESQSFNTVPLQDIIDTAVSEWRKHRPVRACFHTKGNDCCRITAKNCQLSYGQFVFCVSFGKAVIQHKWL